jgi:hypothetical protein
MEADWEIDIGGDAPVIHAHWAGFADLRVEPERVASLPEVFEFPMLGDALIRLNAAESPVWTSKCDVWEAAGFDPDEMDAAPERGLFALACYIDILPQIERKWHSPGQAVVACRALCERLRDIPLRGCRADLVVRRACIIEETDEYGVTAYLTACGSTLEEARSALGEVVGVFADSILSLDNRAADTSTLQ